MILVTENMRNLTLKISFPNPVLGSTVGKIQGLFLNGGEPERQIATLLPEPFFALLLTLYSAQELANMD